MQGAGGGGQGDEWDKGGGEEKKGWGKSGTHTAIACSSCLALCVHHARFIESLADGHPLIANTTTVLKYRHAVHSKQSLGKTIG